MIFVHRRAFGHGPDHRQFALGAYAGHLLGIQRQVVTQYAGGFLAATLVITATSSSKVAMSSINKTNCCWPSIDFLGQTDAVSQNLVAAGVLGLVKLRHRRAQSAAREWCRRPGSPHQNSW